MWLHAMSLELTKEFKRRYHKTHSSEQVIKTLATPPCMAYAQGLTAFAQAMPPQYKGPDAIEAYRAYYKGEKVSFAQWGRGQENPPPWWL